jgi:hypothetical protein
MFMEPKVLLLYAHDLVIILCPRPLCRLAYHAMLFKQQELLTPAKLPKLEDHTLWAVLGCLFSILTATL